MLIFPLCVTYNDKGGIYVTNSTNSFNITVKYPFDYNNNTVVYTNEDAPLDSFNFDPAIQVCAKFFVAVVIVTGFAAVITLFMSCLVHRNERMASKVSIAVSTQILLLLFFYFFYFFIFFYFFLFFYFIFLFIYLFIFIFFIFYYFLLF